MQENILILGLGNPVLGDDGIGLRVVSDLEKQFGNLPFLHFRKSSQAGLYLLELLMGYERAIIADAVKDYSRPVGEIQFLSLADLEAVPTGGSPHYIGLYSVVLLGNSYQLSMPQEIQIVTIVIHEGEILQEHLSDEMQQRYSEIISQMHAHLSSFLKKTHDEAGTKGNKNYLRRVESGENLCKS